MLIAFASRRASAAHDRGDRYRANLWTDVECWLLGYGTWSELRTISERRARQSLPRVPVPFVLVDEGDWG